MFNVQANPYGSNCTGGHMGGSHSAFRSPIELAHTLNSTNHAFFKHGTENQNNPNFSVISFRRGSTGMFDPNVISDKDMSTAHFIQSMQSSPVSFEPTGALRVSDTSHPSPLTPEGSLDDTPLEPHNQIESPVVHSSRSTNLMADTNCCVFRTVIGATPKNDRQHFGPCKICGDRATGKHYGAYSCDGCKGFFRRTIRKGHSYSCRFVRNCLIDKDKRNTCRYCRYKKCVAAGMKPEAVQSERDRISAHFRKSGRSSPPNLENFVAANQSSGAALIEQLMNAEAISKQQFSCDISNASHVSKIDEPTVSPDIRPTNGNFQEIFQRQDSNSSNVGDSMSSNRLASMHDLAEAIKEQLLLLVEWAKALPWFSDLRMDDQITLLRAYSASHLLLGVARRSMPFKDVLLLSNNACIPRSHSSELHDVNHVVFRVLDELVEPMRELQLNDAEYGCLKALIFFNPGAQGLVDRRQVKQARREFLEALQNYTCVAKKVEKNCLPHSPLDKVRFGNILLLSPPLQAMSHQFVEDLQLATLFGMATFDKLLEELLLSSAEPFSEPFLDADLMHCPNAPGSGLDVKNDPQKELTFTDDRENSKI